MEGIVNCNSLLYWIIFECFLFLTCLKEGLKVGTMSLSRMHVPPMHVPQIYSYPYQGIENINDILCTGQEKCYLYVLVGISDIQCTGRETCIRGTCIRGTCIRDKDIVPWNFGSITPLNFINSLYQGFERGNSLYQKLWSHLDNRENRLWGRQNAFSGTKTRNALLSNLIVFQNGNFIWIKV